MTLQEPLPPLSPPLKPPPPEDLDILTRESERVPVPAKKRESARSSFAFSF